MNECSDCRRTLPDSETLTYGKCRICARLPAWRAKGAAATPVIQPPRCPTCKTRPRPWKQDYCKACKKEHNKRWQKEWRARQAGKPVPVKPWENLMADRQRMKDMPGVDIDAIHYKRGMVRKVKKAA